MKCRLDIRQGIINKAAGMVETAAKIKRMAPDTLFVDNGSNKQQAFMIAAKTVNRINTNFEETIAYRSEVMHGQQIKINPPAKLVDEYYDRYIKNYNLEQQLETGIDQFGDSAPVYGDPVLLSPLENDLLELNLTPQVIRYLYEQHREMRGNKAKTYEEYGKIIVPFINNLRSVQTNEEILEQLKCI